MEQGGQRQYMQLEVGAILEGKVTGVRKFGAFVQLPDGVTGMVHISEVSDTYIHEISDVVSDGQTVRVKVLSVSPEGKVALSMKRAQERPPRPQRNDPGKVWQPKPARSAEAMGFEDMMSRFKTQSEEKISDLKRVTEAHRGGGYSRRR